MNYSSQIDQGKNIAQVVNGKYPLSLSSWIFAPQRQPILDHVHLFDDSLLLVLLPQLPKVDINLFTRPFTRESWSYITAMIFLLSITAILPYVLFPSHIEHAAGHQLVYIIAMLFFVIINAYYGGALTMFFTKSPSAPFETLRDVLRDPVWKLIVLDGKILCRNFINTPGIFPGTWANYQFRKNAGDPDYKRLWDRIVKEPHDTLYKDIDDGINRIESGRQVQQTYFTDGSNILNR